MAWIADPNFGSTLVASDATAPFTTGGGNRMLSLGGAGLVYNDSINQANIDIACDLFFTGNGLTVNDAAPGPVLIARRQANGSFYMATLSLSNSGSKTIFLYRYHGPTDTFFQLATGFGTNSWTAGQLLSFRFRLDVDSLASYVYLGSNIIVSAGVVNTSIPSAGAAGIGGRLIGGFPQINSFIDNLRIGQP